MKMRCGDIFLRPIWQSPIGNDDTASKGRIRINRIRVDSCQRPICLATTPQSGGAFRGRDVGKYADMARVVAKWIAPYRKSKESSEPERFRTLLRTRKSALRVRNRKAGLLTRPFRHILQRELNFFQQPRQGPPSTRYEHTSRPVCCQSPVLVTRGAGLIYFTSPFNWR